MRRRILTLQRWWRVGPGLKHHKSDHDDDHDDINHNLNGDDDDDDDNFDDNFNVDAGDRDDDE